MCKKVAFFLILVIILAAGITNSKPLNQDPGPDGIVSVEAEHYDNKTVGDNGDEWVEVGPMGDFTGVAGMQAQPDNNTGSRDTNYAARSPRLDYEIDFVKTGTYYVWILAYGDDGNSDSCHSGLDGEEISTCDRMDGWNGDYEWNSQTMDEPRATFEVTSLGVHTFNIWMREDGLIVDKIVLTTNPDFTLTDSESGPAENSRGPRVTAFSPKPSDGAEDVPRDLVLSWESGLSAGSHDVYFGTSLEDVDQATATEDPTGVYKGRIITNSYTLPERLDFDQTYYWRVDEVGAAPDDTINKGDVWSFNTELFAYAIENVVATASSSEPGKEAVNTVNGSGLDPNGLLHTNIGEDTMWLSAGDANLPAWIEFKFQNVQKLYEMWVWNSNDSLERSIGLGFKNVTIEYSVDGNDYKTLGTTYDFNQAPGTANYAHNTTIDMEGIAAKYVKLTANSNFKNILQQFGLSEVRFFSIPVHAREPNPAVGAADVGLDLNLSFRAGREGDKHDVYFSEDSQAVLDGTTDVETLTDTSYGPLALDLGKTYFWRVDEVNDTETPSVWQGDIWYFTTQEYFVLDDFESYNAAENQIWYAWKDGLGYGTPDTPPYYAGNGTGAAVGDETTDSFTEETIIHGGKQSMPLAYDNNKQGYMNYSETAMTLSSHHDWTARGVKELSLWFMGLPGSVGSFTEGPVGTYTITASGTDIWGTADEFHFAYKQLTGVGSITTKVLSVENADAWSKAGVMIRETLDPGSKFAAVYITSTNPDGTPTQGCRFQNRVDTDGSATSDSSPTLVATPEQMAITAPYWIKLERDFAGNFRGYYSSDGSNWTSMVFRPNIAMSSTVYIGLAVTSHNAALTCEAKFSNVQTTGSVAGQWQSQDVGISSNSAETMYVAVGNVTGTPAVVYYEDPAATQIDAWTEWTIPTQLFADQGVNLTDVDNISIGIGDRNNLQAGGSGTVYIDDIRLEPEPPVIAPKEADAVFEAESADILGESWRTYRDPLASGATYIGSNNGDGSDGDAAPGANWIASYNFTAPEGTYKILLRVIAPTDEDDSCWVRITTATSQTHEDPDQPGTGWVRFNDIELGNEWLWDEVASSDHDGEVVTWTLPAGENTLEIGKREDGLLIDAILITDNLDQTTVE
jgi:hypothetical protein